MTDGNGGGVRTLLSLNPCEFDVTEEYVADL